MAQTLDCIVNDAEFERDYREQKKPKSQQDIFFIWIMLVLISVIGAHFMLNIGGPSSSMTGYVTANESPGDNMSILLYALFVAFIGVLVIGLVHFGVTQKDK
jgi:hypothetical protein